MLEAILDYERDLFLWLNSPHTLFLDHFIWLYSGKIAWIPLAVLSLFVFCYKKNWCESLFILLSIVLVITLCDQFASSVCKPIFTRFRPTRHPEFMEIVKIVFDYRGGRYGFISSHAANAFGFATYTLLLFKNRWYTITILLWATFMAYTRIYLGVHFISDIVPAIVVGLLFGFLVYFLYIFVRGKLRPHAEVPASLYTDNQINLIIYGLLFTVLFMLIYSSIQAF